MSASTAQTALGQHQPGVVTGRPLVILRAAGASRIGGRCTVTGLSAPMTTNNGRAKGNLTALLGVHQQR